MCFNNLLVNMGQLHEALLLDGQSYACTKQKYTHLSLPELQQQQRLLRMSGVTVEDIQYVVKAANWSSEGVF